MDLSGSMQGAGGVGGLLAVDDQVDTYYPTYDGNGNVSEYLNAGGAVAAHYEYDAFGNTTVSTGAKKADFAHRFSTKYEDAETGLYYYGYRYYDPVTGRWPSRDPIGERGGMNLYGFGSNRAVNGIDLLGRDWMDTAADYGAEALDYLKNSFASMEGSVKSKANTVINEFLDKAASGDLSASWRKGSKKIWGSWKKPMDIEVSSNFGYGVKVFGGSSSDPIIRGSLFVRATIEGRVKSPRLWLGAKAIGKVAGTIKVSKMYCYNKNTGDVVFEEAEGSVGVQIAAGVRWETSWYGHSWFNDHWATNKYVEAIGGYKWKWKFPSFEPDPSGTGWGAYVRGVTEKKQIWNDRVQGSWVGVNEHFRISFGNGFDD